MHKVGGFNREEGFSLIELTIVAAIIGVLVSIAMVSFVMSVRTSKQAACKGNLKIVREQVFLYHTKNFVNPPSLGDLVPDYIENHRGIICPETGEDYIYDHDTGDVSCPYHTEY